MSNAAAAPALRAYGSKYASTKSLPATSVAALIRADIKAAVASGAIPKGKYSVRTRGSSMHSAIDVTFETPSIALHNPAWVAFRAESPRVFCELPGYSAEAVALTAHLKAIVNAYNRDDSDIQTDYFNVRFYESVNPASDWEDAEHEAVALRVRALDVSNEMFPAKTSPPESWLAAIGVAS